MRWLAGVCVLSACNSVFGLDETSVEPAPDAAEIDADTRPDLDHDDVADEEDPCIAAAADALFELDSPTAYAQVVMHAGAFGLTASGGDVSISGIAIYERSDAPPL